MGPRVRCVALRFSREGVSSTGSVHPTLCSNYRLFLEAGPIPQNET